ncbi:protein of unknown function [Methanoculleus bourgensis]|uniref:Uncharacterized protein n=1 Tax=Methanoculleus bourgensis TaxID=83986 RepID=A0A0X3BGW4_9EURY|nr:protein of unknown function [Methanoculleus bourgensis]
MTSGRSAWCARRVRGSARSSGLFHLILWVLVQIATSREAAKGAKEYTVLRPNFASSHVLPRELIGCHIKPPWFGGGGIMALSVPRAWLVRGGGSPPMRAATSGAFHLILSMQYHLTRRARSREVRLLGGIVPFAFFASSREVAIARPASGPAT